LRAAHRVRAGRSRSPPPWCSAAGPQARDLHQHARGRGISRARDVRRRSRTRPALARRASRPELAGVSILLVRHGETDSNAARVVQLPDAPLSENGHVQAARLAVRLSGVDISKILSSDYRRAVATAEPLRAKTGAPLELLPELRERNLG